MRRTSFLGNKTDEMLLQSWNIPGLGTHDIGFGICRTSGIVLQTSCVTPEEMFNYYTTTATYVNPANNGKPSPAKVKDLDRLLNVLNDSLTNKPTSALQIGSSDGYTLSRIMHFGVDRVLGVEPGENSRKFAKDNYGVDCINGTAESFECSETFDLIVLTHILEHLYNPLDILIKLKSFTSEVGHLLIEVPLWERMKCQPIGVLTFEHLNYFCEETLLITLEKAGFSATHISKNFNVNHYPVITAVAKKTSHSSEKDTQHKNKFVLEKNKSLLLTHLEQMSCFYSRFNNRISKTLNESLPTYLYGGGIQTSQLLANLTAKKLDNILGVFDSSPAKWGKKIGEYTILKPEELKGLRPGTNIIVSSMAFQAQIAEFIKTIRNDLNLITLKT